jgi:hypothetical protein
VVVVGGGVLVLLVLPRVVVAPVGRLLSLILHPQLPILVVVEVAPVLRWERWSGWLGCRNHPL